MLQICRIVLALFTSVSFFFATMFTAAWGQVRTDQYIEETASMAIYKAAGIRYPIKYKKNGNCNFTEREIKVIRETFQILPEVYASLGNQFFFEKECVLNSKDKNQSLNLDQVHAVASSSSFLGKIILKDLVFSTIQNAALTQIRESFSKKVITHELTHQLDDKYGYSNSDNFRSINSWKSNFGFMTYDKEKAAGFQREQGMKNPQEDFATQAEGFFFEADYICKNPQAYVWFYYWIGPSKVPAVTSCPSEMNTPIDPAKLKDIGYIFISSTDEFAESMFGHSLIRFHMNQADPFEDFAIEAAGGINDMPSLNGYETPEELAEKQAQSETMKVSRLGFLLKGVSGQLDFKVQLIRYKLKWIETSILHGRDISERILALTKLQKRVLVYMINKDLKKYSGIQPRISSGT